MDDYCEFCDSEDIEYIIDRSHLRRFGKYQVISYPTNLLMTCKNCEEEQSIYVSCGIIMI